MITTIRRTLGLVERENRARLLLLVVIALVASAFEVGGAALVYVLLGLVADPDGKAALPVIGDVRLLFDVDQDALLLGLAAAMAVFFLIRAVVNIGQAYIENRTIHEFAARLAARLVAGYLMMPYSFHLSRRSSDLIRTGHQSVSELAGQALRPMVRVSADVIMVAGMLLLLVAVAPVATALAVLVVGGAASLLLAVVQPRLKRQGQVAHSMNKETLGILQQSLHGIRDIKLLGQERAFAERYDRFRARHARAQYLRATVTELPRAVIETALIGFILLFFALAIVGGDTQRSLSVLGLFAYAGLRLDPSLRAIVSALNNLKFADAPIDALYADLQVTEEVVAQAAEAPVLPFEQTLRLEEVSFRYKGAHRYALDQVTLTIQSGEFIGLCGPTGGGKTTLVDVVSGLLVPNTGRVRVDDADIIGDARSWQRNLGVVPQMVFLTDETLRENIALGVSKREIDEEALQEAVDLAQLRGLVSSLPEGLDTVVGERGVLLSGGQRQRVAIARALYRRPSVLIFDEGTSALDNRTEDELLAALDHLRGRHTILMVAHRLSTIRNADRIVLVEDGRIAALGTPGELAASHPEFRIFASTQQD